MYCENCGYEQCDHTKAQSRECRRMSVARAIGSHIEKHVDTNQIIRPKTLDDFMEKSTYTTRIDSSSSYYVYPTTRLDKEKPTSKGFTAKRYNFESSF